MQDPEVTVDGPANGALHHDTSPTSPIVDTSAASYATTETAAADTHGQDEATKKAVDNVLYSDIGVSTLLNRLKQSVASVKDFANFLKRRSGAEDEHAKELRRLCKTTHQDIRKADARQGSYARQFEALTNVHERMADNGLQFALNLHQMHEDLNQLAFEMEKGRKNWKQIGLSAEGKASDAERQMEKAQQKYNTLAEQYDLAKTGDSSGRHFGLRGPKSAEQREEELQKKVDLADKDYQAKVQHARKERQELLSKTRPQAIKALEDLVSECDAGLTLQMQKFATFNERLLLGNGLLVSPLNEPNAPQQRSMRDMIMQIDNSQDFQSYIRSFGVKVPARANDIEYRPHPTLTPKQQQIRQPEPQSAYQPAIPPKDPSPTMHSPPSFAGAAGSMGPNSRDPVSVQPPPAFPMNQYGAQIPDSHPSPVSPKPGFAPYGGGYDRDHSPSDRYNTSPPPGPPALGPGPNQGGYGAPPSAPAYPGQPSPYGRAPYAQGPAPSSPSGPYGAPVGAPPAMMSQGPPPPRPTTRDGRGAPSRPAFGFTLNELFLRDSSPVPLVVYQCIQAVDLFGLDHEGIYRVSGNAAQVQELKSQFDHHAEKVDFRNPEAFMHDVNNAANLMKLFFRELPDPLMTKEHHNDLIEAAKIQDDMVRRDSMHAIINALPDPNYATLRALVLHLHRVEEHSEANRMTASTLALIFAPTLMGTGNGNMSDAGLQPRVIETILANALQIFDDD